MKTEYTNDLPYPNDIPQEVDRWVAKCIRCNIEFVNTLTDPISYASCDLKATSNITSRFLCM